MRDNFVNVILGLLAVAVMLGVNAGMGWYGEHLLSIGAFRPR